MQVTMRPPEQAEKDLRRFLRERSVTLKQLGLEQALLLMESFYREVRDYDVLPEGDGLVAYEDVTDHGRGTRLEIGLIRLFRLSPPDPNATYMPAIRLRLRLCFKWDMDVVSKVLPEGSWSVDCWPPEESRTLVEAVRSNPAYTVMAEKTPSEVNISLEAASYRPLAIRPKADARQMWWGVCDVT